MPRIHPLATVLCTLAFLLPACDPPDEPDRSPKGPQDLADDPDDDEPEPEPRPGPPKRFGNAPRDQQVPALADADLRDTPHGDDASPEPADDGIGDLADARDDDDENDDDDDDAP